MWLSGNFCSEQLILLSAIATFEENNRLDEETMQILLKLQHTWKEINEMSFLDRYRNDEYWTLRNREKVLLRDLKRGINNSFRDRISLAATIAEMLDNGFFKSYEDLYAVLFDRPSQAIEGDNLHSYDEGSSSHSKAPHLSSDRLVVDQELRGTRALGFEDPALKNRVSTDISEYGKNAFDDSDASYQQMQEVLISAGSNGLDVNGINSPPGQFVSLDIPSVVNQQQREEYIGGELDRKKRGCINDGSNGRRDDGINSPLGHYISIDIPSAVNQQWKEYIGNELDRNKRDDSSLTMSTLAITAPAAGTLLHTAISGSSHTSWIVNFMAVAIVIGFAFALASIGLRRVKPMLSGIMIKLGAVSAASAIILALGSTVPPAVAWPAGGVAWLLIAIGVAMA